MPPLAASERRGERETGENSAEFLSLPLFFCSVSFALSLLRGKKRERGREREKEGEFLEKMTTMKKVKKEKTQIDNGASV